MTFYRFEFPLAMVFMGAGCLSAPLYAKDNAVLPDVTVRSTADSVSTSVATRVPASAMEAPYTVTSIPESLIEDSSATSLSDVMRYAATVGGTDNFGNAGEFFTSRGFQLAAGNNYFRDGLRYRKYGQVSLYDIERIEFLRGPGSVLYGALEPGGVVNIVSKKPQPVFGITGKIKLGEHNTRQASVDVTGPAGEALRYRLQAMDSASDSFRDQVSGQSQGVSGQLDMDLARDTQLSVRGSYFKDRRTGDRGTVLAKNADDSVSIARVPASRFLGEPYADFAFEDVNLSIGLKHKLSDQWQLHVDWVHSRQKEDRTYLWAAADNTPVPISGLFNRQVGDWDARLQGSLGRIETVGSFDSGELKQRLLMGAEFERFSNRRTNMRYATDPINIYNPVYATERPANGRQTLNSRYADRFESQSLYAQHMVGWRNAVTIVGGLRYDSVDSKDPNAGSARDHFKGVTPQLGIVFHPAPWISPYVSYARSFLPQDGTDRDGNRFEPQKSSQWEIGTKFDLQDGKTFLTLAAYRLEKRNMKMTDPEAPGFSRLSGLRRSTGLEVALHTQPLQGLNVMLNYALAAQAKFVQDNSYAGKTTPNVPRHALGVFADYALRGDWSRWSTNLGLTHVGERQGTSNNSFQLPAYSLVDVGVRYRFSDHVNVTASLKNAFDRTYYTGAINATTIGMGTPRTAFIGLEFRQ